MSAKRIASLLGALCALTCAAATFAQAPAAAKSRSAALPDIVIGHVAGYTGAVAKDATELRAGGQVFIDAQNERGGIDGRRLRLITADDEFKADKTLQLLAEMKGKAVALLPTVGSANLAALVKAGVLDTPLVGSIPSPDFVRKWQNRNMFHIRASDQQQTEKILEQLITVGINSIAIFVPNNPFGEQAAKQVDAYLAGRKLKLAGTGIYTLVGPKADFAPGIKGLQGKRYQALVMYGPPKIMADSIKELRANGESAQLYLLSFADSNLIVQTAGQQTAHGVVIAQVLPNLNARGLPVVKAFRDDFARFSPAKGEPSYYNFEGYLSARLIAEAIRKSRDASPDGVRRGLEQMSGFDLGGYTIDFSPSSHEGSRFVDLGVITGAGKLLY